MPTRIWRTQSAIIQYLFMFTDLEFGLAVVHAVFLSGREVNFLTNAFLEVYCVYRVTKMGEKVSIMSIFSIVSRLLAMDWQQFTSLEERLVDVNQDFILGSTVEPALITL